MKGFELGFGDSKSPEGLLTIILFKIKFINENINSNVYSYNLY